MRKLNAVLAAALGLQLLLTAVMLWQGRARAPERLLGLRASDIVEIEIEPASVTKPGPGASVTVKTGTPTVLRRQGEHWVLASMQELRVDSKRVTAILDAACGLEATHPIATEPAKFVALGVADDRFERRITFKSRSGRTAVFLLGSLSQDTAAIRIAGGRQAFETRAVTPLSLPHAPGAWFDNTLYGLDPGAITHVEIANAQGLWIFARDAQGWALSHNEEPIEVPKQIAAKYELNPEAIRRFPIGVHTMKFEEPVTGDTSSIEPDVTLVIRTDKAPVLLRIAKIGERYAVQMRGQNTFYWVPNYAIERFYRMGFEYLVKPKAATPTRPAQRRP